MNTNEKREYTIKECLDILNISKATFYSRINLNKDRVSQYIFMKNGKRYITFEGLEFIRCLNNSSDSVQTVQTGSDNVQTTSDILDNRLIDTLKEQIEDLKKDKERLFEELEVKNKQIEDQNRMLENNQIIIQQSQQKIFFLESEDQKRNNNRPWWKKIFQ